METESFYDHMMRFKSNDRQVFFINAKLADQLSKLPMQRIPRTISCFDCRHFVGENFTECWPLLAIVHNYLTINGVSMRLANLYLYLMYRGAKAYRHGNDYLWEEIKGLDNVVQYHGTPQDHNGKYRVFGPGDIFRVYFDSLNTGGIPIYYRRLCLYANCGFGGAANTKEYVRFEFPDQCVCGHFSRPVLAFYDPIYNPHGEKLNRLWFEASIYRKIYRLNGNTLDGIHLASHQVHHAILDLYRRTGRMTLLQRFFRNAIFFSSKPDSETPDAQRTPIMVAGGLFVAPTGTKSYLIFKANTLIGEHLPPDKGAYVVPPNKWFLLFTPWFKGQRNPLIDEISGIFFDPTWKCEAGECFGWLLDTMSSFYAYLVLQYLGLKGVHVKTPFLMQFFDVNIAVACEGPEVDLILTSLADSFVTKNMSVLGLLVDRQGEYEPVTATADGLFLRDASNCKMYTHSIRK